VLEDGAGCIVGIEVKASATVNLQDFKGVQTLAEVAGKPFHRGITFYTGTKSLPFGPQLHALPLQALWRLGS
jgi:hypothetical protein